MKTSEKIKELLECGYLVRTMSDDEFENDCVCYSFIGDEIFYVCEGKTYLDSANLFDDDKIIEIIPRKFKLLPVGMKVRILSVNEPGEIVEIDEECSELIYRVEYRLGGMYCSREDIIPIIDSEPTKEEQDKAIELLRSCGRIKNGEIIE